MFLVFLSSTWENYSICYSQGSKLWAYYNTTCLSFKACAIWRPARRDRGCRGLRWLGNLREGIGAWTAVWQLLPQQGPLHQVTSIKTGGVRGKGRNREKQKGERKEGDNVQENLANDNYARRTKDGDKHTKQTAASRANGVCEVETSWVPNLALLNINFC